MKKVILVYDISSDLIECSDRIADDFKGLYDWIENDPEGAEYKVDLGGGEIGCIESTESILKYLNTKCLKQGYIKQM